MPLSYSDMSQLRPWTWYGRISPLMYFGVSLGGSREQCMQTHANRRHYVNVIPTSSSVSAIISASSSFSDLRW